MSLEDFLPIMLAPDYIFDKTPRGITKAIGLMSKSGTLKTQVQSWKDMYFPEAHTLPGN
jgi:NitT/TauT family transport system substrate-binding protein